MRKSFAFILIALTVMFACILMQGCGRAYDKRTFFVHDKTFVLKNGATVPAIIVIQCTGTAKHERRSDNPRLLVEIPPENFNKIEMKKYYYPEELTELGAKFPVEKENLYDMPYNGYGYENIVYISDKVIDCKDGNSSYLLVLIYSKGFKDINKIEHISNPRMRVEVTPYAYDKVREKWFYSIDELKNIGVNIPAEQEDKQEDTYK